MQLDIGGVDPDGLAVRAFAEKGGRDNHALRQQIGERLVDSLALEQSGIAHQLGPEARIEQMQNGMFDAADILINAAFAPVGDALVDHGPVVVRAAVAQEVPRGFDESIHRIGFASGGLPAFGTRRFVKFRHSGERTARTGDGNVFRQHHRQLIIGYGNVAAGLAVDDRNRAAPVALTRDAPVAQAELHFLLAQPFGDQIGSDGIDGGFIAKAVVLARIDAKAVFAGVPVFPVFVRKDFILRPILFTDDLRDGQAVFLGEREIAFIVRRHGHDCAVAIAHQHVVADPDFDFLTR